MSEPNWRELGDPWADRLPPPPRSEVSFRHAHRLAQTRRMSPVDPQQGHASAGAPSRTRMPT
jgi:hypothetical protein